VPSISKLFVKDRAELLRFLQMYFALSIVIGVGAAVSLYLVSDWIVTLLFGAKYLEAIPLLKIWALGMLPLTPLAIFFAGSLVPCNASKAYFYCSLAGAIVTVGSIPVLVWWLGLGGVPFASIVSELVITITGAYFLAKQLKLTGPEMLALVNIPAAIRALVGIIRTKSVPGFGKDS
jgi:O-antigen/teichoic acid export membrane protein